MLIIAVLDVPFCGVRFHRRQICAQTGNGIVLEWLAKMKMNETTSGLDLVFYSGLPYTNPILMIVWHFLS